MKGVRFGGISFINAYPLIRTTPPGGKKHLVLSQAPPSELFEKLICHELDAAMIPSYSLFTSPLSYISGHYAIAGDGPVRTVCLYCKKPLDHGIRIGLDRKSRTSVILLKILMAISGYQNIDYLTLSYHEMINYRDIDALLLIGDDNFNPELETIADRIDLGHWWKELKGIPFVYAVIAGHSPESLDTVHAWLDRNYESWQRKKDRWVKEWSIERGFSEKVLKAYLTKNILHKLNPGHIETGVRVFQELCFQYGFLKKITPFYCQV